MICLSEKHKAFEKLVIASLAGSPLEHVSIYTVTKAFVAPWHAYPFFELHYVHSGKLTWEIAGGSHLHIRGGDVTVVQPNTRHRSLHSSEKPSTFLALIVPPHPPSLVPPFTTAREQAEAFRILRKAGTCVMRGCPQLPSLFLALRSAARVLAGHAGTKSPASTGLLWVKLHEVLCCILRSLADPVHATDYPSVKRAMQYMEQHLADDISVDRLAREAGLGRARFYAAFHLQTGETPAAYLLRRRLEESAVSLAKSDFSIGHIADRFGFSSSQGFSKMFRRHFDLTPTAYRRSCRKENAGNRGSV